MTIEAINRKIQAICEPLGQRVHTIVNYERFVLDRDMEDAWAVSISEIVQRWYASVTRLTTGAFLRAKLGAALARRSVAPHVFETEQEARNFFPLKSNEVGATP